MGNPADAGRTLSQAMSILETVADRLPSEEMRSVFLDSPHVARNFHADLDGSRKP